MTGTTLLTVKEAAAVARISTDHFYKLIRTGDIAAVRIGRRLLINRSTLHQWLQEKETAGID